MLVTEWGFNGDRMGLEVIGRGWVEKGRGLEVMERVW